MVRTSITLPVMALVKLSPGFIDERTVNGVPWMTNVSAKSLKFHQAKATQVLTIAWTLAWLKRGWHAA